MYSSAVNIVINKLWIDIFSVCSDLDSPLNLIPQCIDLENYFFRLICTRPLALYLMNPYHSTFARDVRFKIVDASIGSRAQIAEVISVIIVRKHDFRNVAWKSVNVEHAVERRNGIETVIIV